MGQWSHARYGYPRLDHANDFTGLRNRDRTCSLALGHIRNTTEVPLAIDDGNDAVDDGLPSALVIHWAGGQLLAFPVAARNVHAICYPKAISLSASCYFGPHCRITVRTGYVVEVELPSRMCKISFHGSRVEDERTWHHNRLHQCAPLHDPPHWRTAASSVRSWQAKRHRIGGWFRSLLRIWSGRVTTCSNLLVAGNMPVRRVVPARSQ